MEAELVFVVSLFACFVVIYYCFSWFFLIFEKTTFVCKSRMTSNLCCSQE